MLEDGFLDLEFLENRLDHEVAIGQVRVVERGRKKGHPLFVFGLCQLALRDLGFVVLAHGGDPAIKGLLLRLQHHDRNTRIEEIHRDPAAHRTGADHRHFMDGADRGVFGNIGDLAGRSFGKEGMAQRLALGRLHQLNKQFALESKTCVDLLLGRRGHGIDAAQGSRKILRHRADGIARELKISIRIGMSTFQITHQRERPGRRNFVRKGNRALHQVPRDHPVEQLLSW